VDVHYPAIAARLAISLRSAAIDGFGQKRVGAALQGFSPRIVVAVGRNHDYTGTSREGPPLLFHFINDL
jgi:hypothetical protein